MEIPRFWEKEEAEETAPDGRSLELTCSATEQPVLLVLPLLVALVIYAIFAIFFGALVFGRVQGARS